MNAEDLCMKDGEADASSARQQLQYFNFTYCISMTRALALASRHILYITTKIDFLPRIFDGICFIDTKTLSARHPASWQPMGRVKPLQTCVVSSGVRIGLQHAAGAARFWFALPSALPRHVGVRTLTGTEKDGLRCGKAMLSSGVLGTADGWSAMRCTDGDGRERGGSAALRLLIRSDFPTFQRIVPLSPTPNCDIPSCEKLVLSASSLGEDRAELMLPTDAEKKPCAPRWCFKSCTTDRARRCAALHLLLCCACCDFVMPCVKPKVRSCVSIGCGW